MPIILSHRGNLIGPCAAAENRLPAVRAALECGWGVETDIRRAADGRFYIAHDARSSAHETPAEDFFALFREYPHATIALNIKELGHEDQLIEFLDHEDVVAQTFLFDMELIEERAGTTARAFRELHPTIQIAARISDRGESIDQALAIDVASVIWLDEFDHHCFTASAVRRLKDAGRTVYAVSPDLHGKPAENCRRRWLEFIRWGVDGICTDYPTALSYVLSAVEHWSGRVIVRSLNDMVGGWIVGNFEPSCLKTAACEVACKHYQAGEAETAHLHRIATEVTLIAVGRVVMNGRPFNAGDIIVLEPGEATDFRALEKTTTVVVKMPSVLGDKYPVAAGGTP